MFDGLEACFVFVGDGGVVDVYEAVCASGEEDVGSRGVELELEVWLECNLLEKGTCAAISGIVG